jgi:hypothetical protein
MLFFFCVSAFTFWEPKSFYAYRSRPCLAAVLLSWVYCCWAANRWGSGPPKKWGRTMKIFLSRQHPQRKYRFDIIGNKKALKIRWDSTLKSAGASYIFQAGCAICYWKLVYIKIHIYILYIYTVYMCLYIYIQVPLAARGVCHYLMFLSGLRKSDKGIPMRLKGTRLWYTNG